MKHSSTLVPVLLLAFAGACASSRGDGSRLANSASTGHPDDPVAERPPYPADDPGYPVDRASPPDGPAYTTDRPQYPTYSPYQVEITGGDYHHLPTYAQSGRTYVLGTIGERYRIHITNTTSRRVEAVVSVDGLDAIDGKTADVAKRGYVIPAYGDITVDGFRTSLNDVATFRFSSVRDSYAGRKGQDRNVGVIGVAFFPQREMPIARPVRPPLEERRAPVDDRLGSAAPAPAAPKAAPSAVSEAEGGGGRSEARKAEGSYPRPAPERRPGLGTEFGESRYSHVDYTTFQRENPGSPASVVEIRYNDREGLLALGIPATYLGPADDTALRESATPFPRNRFATPPPQR
jgi:hypothetical protein